MVIYQLDYCFPPIMPDISQKKKEKENSVIFDYFSDRSFEFFIFSVVSLQLKETYKSTLRLKITTKDKYIFQTFHLKELIPVMMNGIIFDLVFFVEVSTIMIHWDILKEFYMVYFQELQNSILIRKS